MQTPEFTKALGIDKAEMQHAFDLYNVPEYRAGLFLADSSECGWAVRGVRRGRWSIFRDCFDHGAVSADNSGAGIIFLKSMSDTTSTAPTDTTAKPRLREKGRLLSASEIERTLVRLAHEIVERNNGAANLGLVEHQSVAACSLAQRIAKHIATIEEGASGHGCARHQLLPRRPLHAL